MNSGEPKLEPDDRGPGADKRRAALEAKERASFRPPLELSLDPSPSPGGAEAARAPEPERPPRVLIVEDNADYRKLIALLFREAGMTVAEAADGVEGGRLAGQSKPDLALIDFNLPRLNGYELIKELRRHDETRRIPVVLITGAANRRSLRELDWDALEFVEKPVPNRILLNKVTHHLARLGFPPRSRGAACAPAAEPPEAQPAAEAAPAPEPAAPAGDPWSGAPAKDEPPPRIRLGATLPPAPEDPPPEPEPAPAEEAGASGLPDDPGDDEILETVDLEEERRRAEREQGMEALAADSPLVRRVHRLLVQAVERGASDIHIEPHEGSVLVRYRVDGALAEVCSLPSSLHPRLATRIKIMANLIITEQRLPQDGQFRVKIKGRKVDFRVNTMPSAYGEKIALRLLASQGFPRLETLGLAPRDFEAVRHAIGSPHGLLLVTGPTGSGKTTTLYSVLATLNKPDVNILTAEDPIEYRLPGITQVQMHPAIGLTFESALRAFLRQDPDVMLVGEIRDLDTADIAVKASVTGHLVMSTLHTNSAPGAVLRLAHIGVPPYLLAASVRLIVAQRLVRRLCAACAAPAPLADDERGLLKEEELAAVGEAKRAVGCERCRGSGYCGRLPIFEVLAAQSAAMRKAIESNDAPAIASVAAADGMTPLRAAALRAVAAGQTSLADALKVACGDR